MPKAKSEKAKKTKRKEQKPPKLKERGQGNFFEALVLLLPSGLWLFLLLVLPTLVILQLSLVPNIKPGMVVDPSGLENYLRAFEGTFLRVILRSLFLAVATTFSCLILGFPVAFWIGYMLPRGWRNLCLLAFILPLWTSSLLRSYAWISILRPTGLLNSVLAYFDLPPVQILNSPIAVLIGMTYSYLPFMVLILYTAIEKLDSRVLEAAADLGAKPSVIFKKITIPQTSPGILAGCLLVFIGSLGDFVDPELLGGASSMTMARLIYNQFLGTTQNWGFGSALSMLLIIAVSIAIALLLKYGDRSATEA
jgi:spermidine/putrescine transport system permease protein